MKLYNIADPTGHDDGWVANKGYVDTEVGKIDSKIDTVVEPLASKEYVNDRIPPTYGSPYKYRNTDTTAENLQPGEFFVTSAGNAYFHPFDAKGRELVTTSNHSHSTDVAGIFKVMMVLENFCIKWLLMLTPLEIQITIIANLPRTTL